MRTRGRQHVALVVALVATALPLSGCAFTPGFYACLLSGAADSAACASDSVAPGPPAAPTGLSAAVAAPAPGATSPTVELDWADNAEPDLRAYNIYSSTTPGGPYAFRGQQDTSGSSSPASAFTDSCAAASGRCHLAACTVYYVVAAVDELLQTSAFSSEVAVRLDCDPPAAPAGLTATADEGEVRLDWGDNAEADVAYYNVYRAAQATGPFARVGGAFPTYGSAYTDDGLTSGIELFYRVTAVDISGNESAPSPVVSAIPLAPPPHDEPPAAPTGLTAVAGDGLVRLDWNDNAEADIDHYVVLRGAVPVAGSPAQVFTTPVSEFVDRGLPNGTTVYYWVRAWDRGGNISGFSAVVSATPAFGALPPAPTGLTATPGDGLVHLAWTAATGLAGYNVYRAAAAGSPFAKLNSAPVAAAEYADSGLANGTEVFYRVTAVDVGASESEPAAVSATPLAAAATLPPAPADLTATAGDELVRLRWTPGAGLYGYNVYRAASAAGPFVKLNTDLVPLARYVDTGLVNGTAYFYRVTAFSTAGSESVSSTVASATPVDDLVPPAAPTGLLDVADDHVIHLHWDANGELDLAGYNIYQANAAAGPFTRVNGALDAAAAYDVLALPNYTDFFFRVTAVDASGNESAVSSTVQAIACLPIECPPGTPHFSRRRTAGAAAAVPATSAPFQLTVGGAYVPGGSARLDGTTIVGSGLAFKGSFRLELATRAASGLVRSRLRGGWRLLTDWRLDPATGTGNATGVAVATFANPRDGKACLRVEERFAVERRPGKPAHVVTRGTFTLLGGSGRAARLLGRGAYDVLTGVGGQETYRGRLRTAHGALPRLPAACRPLTQIR